MVLTRFEKCLDVHFSQGVAGQPGQGAGLMHIHKFVESEIALPKK